MTVAQVVLTYQTYFQKWAVAPELHWIYKAEWLERSESCTSIRQTRVLFTWFLTAIVWRTCGRISIATFSNTSIKARRPSVDDSL